MRRVLIDGAMAGVAAVTFATASVAQYRRAPLIGGGYSDKRVSENRWKVSGFAVKGPRADQQVLDDAITLALYRAAILLKRAGFSHFQIVNSNISGSANIYARNALADFTVVGTNTPDIAIPCEAKPKWASNCRLLTVEEPLTRGAATLGRNVDEDLAADPGGKPKP